MHVLVPVLGGGARNSLILTFYFVCINVLYVHCVCAMHTEPRRGHQNPWSWSYRGLLAATWVLGAESKSSVRALNH